jgi:hypothetical protein
MSEPFTNVVPPRPEPEPRERSALQYALLVLLGLLTVVSISTALYMITVGVDLRAAQQRIECQAGQTDQLRQAATIERDGLRPVFDAIKTGDRDAIRGALDGYQAATVKADGVRQAMPACQGGGSS